MNGGSQSQVIDVPGVGEVEFPAGMSDDDMSAAIRRNYPHLNQNGGQPRFAGTPVTADDARRELARRELARRQGSQIPRFDGIPADDKDSAYLNDPNLSLDQKKALTMARARRRRAGAEGAEPQFSGGAMNATAGLNEGLYGIAGAPVDLMAGAMNLGIRGYNAVTGSDVATIDDPFGGSRSIARGMGAIRPEFDPNNTVANSTGERVTRGIGQGVAGAVLPAGIVGGASRAGALNPAAARVAEALTGPAGSAREAAIGGISGAGSAVGQEMASDKYKDIAGLLGGLGGAATGVGVGALFNAGRTFVQPFTGGGREALAGRRLAEGASDVNALRRSLDNAPDPLVPGSRPTTFQQTGDLGIGVMEKNAANRAPDRFAERRGEQNEARIGAMRGLEPHGAPERVASTVRQHLDDLEAESERMIGAATDAARSRASAIGDPMTPDAAGGEMRGAIEAARAQAKDQERALWRAVDPQGTMVLDLNNTRQSAQSLAKELSPLAQPMTEAERQIYGAIGQAGEKVPLRAMQDLQSHLKAVMREERSTKGETPAYRRMSIVSAGIAKDFDDAVAGRVAEEAKAVQSGQMRPQDTFEARWAQEIEAWRDRREAAAGGDGGPAPRGYAGGREVGVPGAYGTEGQANRQFGGPTGNPSLSSDAGGTGFDGAAFDRLNSANQATRQRATTFDNPTLAPIRRRPSTASPYDMPAGIVPQRIFHPGRGSFEAIGQLRQAIGDDAATNAIQGYAVGDILRTTGRDDGTLDPSRLASWRRSHADALRALPGLDARLADAGRASEAIAEVAASRRAVSAATQKGALGSILKVDDPQGVVRVVGGLFSRQDATAQFRQLRQAIGGDKDAAQGLRRAVIEHLNIHAVGNTEVGASGIAGMKSDTFQTFVRRNGSALREVGFSDAELGTLQAIADDLQRSGRSISGVKNPGGSDTMQNAYDFLRGETPFRAAMKLLGPAGGAGAGAFVMSGSTTGAAATVATGLTLAMRNAGLRTVDDLVTDAMLNPERARLLLSKVKPSEEGARVKALIRSFNQSGIRSLSSDDSQTADGRRAEMPAHLDRNREIAELLLKQSGQGGQSFSETSPGVRDVAKAMGLARLLGVKGQPPTRVSNPLFDVRPNLSPEREAVVQALLGAKIA